MTETFHRTRSMRIGSTVLTALLRAGVPLGSLTLLSVRRRMSGKISTNPGCTGGRSLTPRYSSRSLRKNLLLWRKNLGASFLARVRE